MKKQLLFDLTKSLFGKRSFRMAAFTALSLLSGQSSFGQTWVGATSSDFSDATNWSAAPTYTIADVFLVNAVVAPNFNPMLNAAATCSNITTKVGSVFTTSADFTTGTIVTSILEGTVNINAGTWSSSKLYIGSGSGGAGVVNVATGGILKGTGTETGIGVWRIGSTNNSGTHYLHVNDGGTFIIAPECGVTIGFTSSRKGVLNVNTGGLAQISGGLSISTTTGNGTINVAGGSLEYSPVDFNTGAGKINITAGSFKLLNTTGTTSISATSTSVTGAINITGGTLDAAGPLTIGNSTADGLVTVNLTGGTMNIAGILAIPAPVTAGTYTGLINVDAGSIVLAGDQKAAMETLAVATNIGGIKAVAGKTISVTYDAGTDKTTVIAALPLGVNDAKLDAKDIVVYSQNQNIKIQSENGILSDVKVYGVTGRLVASKKSIGSNEASIAVDASNGVYLVKVTTTDGKVVTKKIM
jgi:hypothetical protein